MTPNWSRIAWVVGAVAAVVAFHRATLWFRSASKGGAGGDAPGSGRNGALVDRSGFSPTGVGATQLAPGAGPLILLPSVIELARTPTAARFESPTGSSVGAFAFHLDLTPSGPSAAAPTEADNAGATAGTAETPVGTPWPVPELPAAAAVRACADGLVVFAGRSPAGVSGAGAGHTVVLAHRLEDGSVVQSGYDRLGPPAVAAGDPVVRGQPLGEPDRRPNQPAAPPRFWISDAPVVATSPPPPLPPPPALPGDGPPTDGAGGRLDLRSRLPWASPLQTDGYLTEPSKVAPDRPIRTEVGGAGSRPPDGAEPSAGE